MTFLRDNSAKNFFIGIICFLLLLCVSDIITARRQSETMRNMLIEHDSAAASSLLEHGVPEITVAEAITNTDVSEAGSRLTDKLGMSSRNSRRIAPLNAFNSRLYASIIVKSVVFSVVLLMMFFLFFINRERLYKKAMHIVSDYSDGIFERHLPQFGDGQLFRLFERINVMAAALQSKHEAEHNTKEFLKTTVSDISHQLKTPLSALSMYNEIILDEPENTEAVISFTKKSDAAIERIKTLMLTLLKITRLDAGGICFDKAYYPVKDVIAASVENLTVRAEKEGKVITADGGDADIFCDIVWTSEAVSNLVKNALDHTPRGARIDITWDKNPMYTNISVKDNGSGIAPEDFHHIFKRFYRSKSASDTQGIGLGLPLAKAITEGQDGIISASSIAGSGTEFTLNFPRG